MFDKQQRKIKRTAKLVRILSKYGFQDLLIRMNLGKSSESSIDGANQLSTYERIRLVLEELGPTFIKLGQTLSTREDMLPKELIVELEKLQDNTETMFLDVAEMLEQECGLIVEEHFLNIQELPIAAASIAQVYKAELIDGSPVIIKVKRPGIDEVIEDDVLILKDLVTLIDTYSDIAEQINMKNAILTFEKSLKEELSLQNELNNIKRFAANFEGDENVYVAKVYEQYSSKNILTMEFIDGIKVTDIERLQAHDLDPIKISEMGYHLFVKQILEHGFFHADPHAGNILVKKDGRLVFIDFGAVGKIPAADLVIFESLVLHLFTNRPKKIVRDLKEIALYYDIPNERKFESDVIELLEFIQSSSLGDIDIVPIIMKMKDILGENKLVMPDYFYLLFKGIGLIDGVGRKLNPELDVLNSLKPFVNEMMLKKISPENLGKKGLEKMSEIMDDLEVMPNEIRSVLHKMYEDKLSVQTEIKNFARIELLLKSSVTNLILGMILAANMVATSLFMYGNVGPKIFGISLLALASLMFTGAIMMLLLARLLRR